jgi:ribosomal protein S26
MSENHCAMRNLEQCFSFLSYIENVSCKYTSTRRVRKLYFCFTCGLSTLLVVLRAVKDFRDRRMLLHGMVKSFYN